MLKLWNLVASKYQADDATVRRAALWSVITSVIIVVAGGAVRLTSSGLGCPTWPQCTGTSLTPTPAMGIHGVIEFSNRMLIYLLCAAVGWLIITASLQRRRRPELVRLAWAQFGLVVAEAVLGGLSVLTKLNPFMVAAHFLLAMVFIVVTVRTWERAREGDGAPRSLVPGAVRSLGYALTGVTALLLVVGTGVTGTGPHSGDTGVAARMPFDWDRVAQLHGDLVFLVCGLTVALLFVLKAVGGPRAAFRRTVELTVLLVLQAAVGYWQYFTGLPAWLVGIHVAGACLVWIATLRIPFALRERRDVQPGPQAPTAAETGATGADQPLPAAAN
ncbi:heme A synthase [Streptacidiphilus sp. P02-A3a]|uniref:COX15/CtaA family protein n=1 Tax=Streptacidiphilus sp. P02-A3a TaxID=2704468 RepID=UPI0015FC5160|nr:COX15/CtaA family protein [Streptacidiphilus sp. P02-A3a]QMU71068.1 heme A synthase [Streptacidiphilus sp. P02-A3a]